MFGSLLKIQNLIPSPDLRNQNLNLSDWVIYVYIELMDSLPRSACSEMAYHPAFLLLSVRRGERSGGHADLF